MILKPLPARNVEIVEAPGLLVGVVLLILRIRRTARRIGPTGLDAKKMIIVLLTVGMPLLLMVTWFWLRKG